ncbi:MAG: hypothetical protein EGP89_00125 [Ruminococcaceae bacterium]|nr:hypothetical protein [Oscillospiraceae bacterium]
MFFSAPQKKQTQNPSFQTRKFALLYSAAAQLVAFLREEGVTRERDGRSPRDGKMAHFSFFAPQPDTG